MKSSAENEDDMESSHGSEDVNVCTLFDRSVQLYPSRIAVSDRGRPYNYAALSREVDRIACALLALRRAPQARICLAVSHGIDLVASVLAVLKIGAVYVPVDTRNPIDRIRYIREDSGASAILYSRQHAGTAADLGIAALCVDDVPEAGAAVSSGTASRSAGPSDLAYILYTSGSTGVPKGVGITHGNLLNYVSWATDRYIQSVDDRIALYSTLAFDFTVTCIFPPLIAGASIGIYDGIADPMVIRDIIADRDINIIKITPSYLHVLSQLLDGQDNISRLIVGGEDLKVGLAAKLHSQLTSVEIINEYGPTEATVGCVFHAFDPETDRSGSVPIGVAIPGVRAYVVGEDGCLVEGDREGELWLSGRSVANGYMNSEARSRAVFIDNPFEPGTILYRTGDIVRRNGNGDLLFVGRKDDQVKIRGNRIELSEVTAALLGLPMVTSAYVTPARDHGFDTLVAVVTGADDLDEDDIVAQLQHRLPSYMIPTLLRVIAEIPMTSNQKVDRAAVLALLGKGKKVNMGTSTDNEYQRIVNAILPMWTELLNKEHVTAETDFFRAGGHSLTAMLLVARVERELGKSVPLFALTKNPTVSAFAKYVLESATGTKVMQAKSMDGFESQTEYLLRFNEAGRQDRRNKAFEKYYAMAMNSAAHAEFCQKVYGKNFGQHGMADFSQIDIMLDKLKPAAGDVVLDIGCGYGLISRYIAEQTGANVVGIDLSQSAIKFANTLAEKNDRLQFHVMDLRQLQFPRDTFSHIVSIDTIYYTPSVRSTLQRLEEIGSRSLRLAIMRTFPIRSFTRDTWSPHVTELATLLTETFGGYDVTDFSKEENEHWRKKVEALESLRQKFIDEGSEELFQFRYKEARYEASIEQFRCMFVSGHGFGSAPQEPA